MSTLTVEIPNDLATGLERESQLRQLAPADLVRSLIEDHLPSGRSAGEKRAAFAAFIREWSGAGQTAMTDEEIRRDFLAAQTAKHCR